MKRVSNYNPRFIEDGQKNIGVLNENFIAKELVKKGKNTRYRVLDAGWWSSPVSGPGRKGRYA